MPTKSVGCQTCSSYELKRFDQNHAAADMGNSGLDEFIPILELFKKENISLRRLTRRAPFYRFVSELPEYEEVFDRWCSVIKKGHSQEVDNHKSWALDNNDFEDSFLDCYEQLRSTGDYNAVWNNAKNLQAGKEQTIGRHQENVRKNRSRGRSRQRRPAKKQSDEKNSGNTTSDVVIAHHQSADEITDELIEESPAGPSTADAEERTERRGRPRKHKEGEEDGEGVPKKKERKPWRQANTVTEKRVTRSQNPKESSEKQSSDAPSTDAPNDQPSAAVVAEEAPIQLVVPQEQEEVAQEQEETVKEPEEEQPVQQPIFEEHNLAQPPMEVRIEPVQLQLNGEDVDKQNSQTSSPGLKNPLSSPTSSLERGNSTPAVMTPADDIVQRTLEECGLIFRANGMYQLQVGPELGTTAEQCNSAPIHEGNPAERLPPINNMFPGLALTPIPTMQTTTVAHTEPITVSTTTSHGVPPYPFLPENTHSSWKQVESNSGSFAAPHLRTPPANRGARKRADPKEGEEKPKRQRKPKAEGSQPPKRGKKAAQEAPEVSGMNPLQMASSSSVQQPNLAELNFSNLGLTPILTPGYFNQFANPQIVNQPSPAPMYAHYPIQGTNLFESNPTVSGTEYDDVQKKVYSPNEM